MNEHLSEAICVIVTSIIAGVIRFFEKKKIIKDQELKAEEHFKKF